MNKFLQLLRKNWIYFLPIFLLLLFIASILDRNYYFGGDLMYPLKPENNIIRSLYLWEEQNGGYSFFKYMLLFWQEFFYVLSLFQIPIDIIMKIFIITIYLLGFIFSYLLYRTLFRETEWGSKKFATFFALLFILNPAAILVIPGTLPLYGFPICFFFLIKYLDTKKILYIIPFSFFLNISFFPDLPQTKYLIVFIIAVLFFLILYSLLRNVKIKSLFLPMFLLTIMTFLLNAFLLVPFVNDAFGEKGIYQYYTSAVITYNGDADLYSAAIPFTTRFYNSNLVDNNSDLGHFLANPFFISWTFFLLFFGLLSVFLVQDKKDKKLVYLALFAFLVFIFIAKGANPPFGEIYRWSLSHIPIAKLFRTSSTSIIGAVIFYTLLVTMSIYYISRRWKLVLPIIVVCNVAMLYGVYLGFKLENPYQINQKGISIPNEYFEMGNILDNLKKEGKVILLPLNDGYVTKNWSYTGQSLIPWLTKKPVIANDLITTDNLDTSTFDQLCSFTSLYNIRYFLQEKDSLSREIKKDIDYQGKNLIENNFFKLQEANESCFLSHIYGSENTIYFKGNIKDITSLAYLPIYDKTTVIFTDNLIKSKQDEKELITKVKNLILENSPKNVDKNFAKKKYVYSVLGEDHLIGDVIYPYIHISPNSIFYPLIVWKEEDSLKKIKPYTRQMLDLELLLASKRINEVSTWGVSATSWHKTQILFKSYMEQSMQTAANSENNTYNLELVYEFIQGFRKEIRKDIKFSSSWNKEKVNSWTKLFDNLEQQIRNLYIVSDYNNLSYRFSVPFPGDYHGYMLLDNGKPIKDDSIKMKVLVNNDQIASYSAEKLENKRIEDLGLLNFSSIKNTMSVQMRNRENLIDSSRWNTVEQMQSVTVDSGSILFSSNLKVTPQGVYSNPVIYQEIKKWTPGTTYFLRIRHKEQNEGRLHLRIRERKQHYDKNSDSWISVDSNVVDEDISTKPKGDELKLLVTADKNATLAYLYLSGVNDTVKIESVELERITVPKIYLIYEKNNQKTTIAQQPIVNFTRVDPTKYTVTISNITNPFFLVFSETFDIGWKIYGRDNINFPEERHFLVNGYANAWSINPQDANKGTSNEFIIEYVPQRLFYTGIIISVISLCACIVYGLYRFFRKSRYNSK